MKLFKRILTPLVVFGCVTVAHADYHVINNTDNIFTGHTKQSPCSSIAGDIGVIKAHSSKTIPSIAMDLYCAITGCTASVYASKDCTGPLIAKVSINGLLNITNVENYDPTIKATISGSTIVIDPA